MFVVMSPTDIRKLLRMRGKVVLSKSQTRRYRMDKDTTKSALAEYLVPLNTESILQELNRLQLDRYVKKLGTAQFIELFVYAQVKQIGTLTDISLELDAKEELQKEINLESISASQLSRKLRDVPSSFMRHSWISYSANASSGLVAKWVKSGQMKNLGEFIWSTHPRFPCACHSIGGQNFGKQRRASSCTCAWRSWTTKWFPTK